MHVQTDTTVECWRSTWTCFSGGQSEEAQPVLVIRERDTKILLCFLVRENGANDPHVIRRVLG